MLMPYESLARHIAAHHPAAMDLAYALKRRFKYQCPVDVCMASFQTRERLQKHMRHTVHPSPLAPPLPVDEDGMILDLPPWDAPLRLLGEPCRPLPDIMMEDGLYSM